MYHFGVPQRLHLYHNKPTTQSTNQYHISIKPVSHQYHNDIKSVSHRSAAGNLLNMGRPARRHTRRPARRPARRPTRRPIGTSWDIPGRRPANSSSRSSSRRKKFGCPQSQQNPRAQLRSHARHVHEEETVIDFPIGVPISHPPNLQTYYVCVHMHTLRGFSNHAAAVQGLR